MVDKNTPLTFMLPDGDSVALITWDFVLSQLEKELSPMVNSMSLINQDLQRMVDRLDDLNS